MSRQDLARVTLRVEGRDCGSFMKREGGGRDSGDKKIRPGGGEEEVILGGPPTREIVKLTGLQTLEKRELVRWLDSRAGRGGNDQAVCSEHPIDGDGNVNGPPFTWRGSVKSVKPADTDSTSDGNESEFEVEILTAGPIG